MPDRFRTRIVTRYLGPAPGWAVREAVEGQVAVAGNTTVSAASALGGRAALTLRHEDGATTTAFADHVICATGFRIAVDRTSFLERSLAQQISQVAGAPRLSRHFESSVPGLYFIGPAAANSFGPMLRFACGAGFAAHRVSHHLAATTRRAARAETGPTPRRALTADV